MQTRHVRDFHVTIPLEEVSRYIDYDSRKLASKVCSSMPGLSVDQGRNTDHVPACNLTLSNVYHIDLFYSIYTSHLDQSRNTIAFL